MSESSYGQPTSEQLADSARNWAEKGAQHLQAAEFCNEQAKRFLARIGIEEATDRPVLILLQGGLE